MKLLFLQKFDANEDFFWYTDSHDSSHGTFFCIDVDETFVDA